MDSVVEIQIVSEKKIQNKFVTIRGTKMELRKIRKELKDNLEGDAEYHDQALRVKEERAKLNARKQLLENVPAIEALKAKASEVKSTLKDEQLELSNWLVDYTKKTGNTTIPDDANNIVEIEVKTVASIKNI